MSNAPSDASVDDNVLDLWQDPAGTLWIATDADGLWHLTGGRITAFRPPPETGRRGVRRLLPDSTGVLWVGTDGGGLWRLDGGRFEAFATRDGLPSDLVHALLDDPGGGVWVGTRDGLAHLRRRAFTAGRAGGAHQRLRHRGRRLARRRNVGGDTGRPAPRGRGSHDGAYRLPTAANDHGPLLARGPCRSAVGRNA